MTERRLGRNLDVLVTTGAVQVFRCRRDRRIVAAVWVFVGFALAGCILAAVL